jgi:hypothetical protein
MLGTRGKSLVGRVLSSIHVGLALGRSWANVANTVTYFLHICSYRLSRPFPANSMRWRSPSILNRIVTSWSCVMEISTP